jgi:hypothetical protein
MPTKECFLLTCFNRLIETIEQLAGGGAGLVSCWINKPNIIIITFVSFVRNKDIKGLFITMFGLFIQQPTNPGGGGGDGEQCSTLMTFRCNNFIGLSIFGFR